MTTPSRELKPRSTFLNTLFPDGLTQIKYPGELLQLMTDMFYAANIAKPVTQFGQKRTYELHRIDRILDIICMGGTKADVSQTLTGPWTADSFIDHMAKVTDQTLKIRRIEHAGLMGNVRESVIKTIGATASLASSNLPRVGTLELTIMQIAGQIFGRDLTDKEKTATQMHFSTTIGSPRNYLPLEPTNAVLEVISSEYGKWNPPEAPNRRRFVEILGSEDAAPISARAILRHSKISERSFHDTMNSYVKDFQASHFGEKPQD